MAFVNLDGLPYSHHLLLFRAQIFPSLMGSDEPWYGIGGIGVGIQLSRGLVKEKGSLRHRDSTLLLGEHVH